MYSYDAVPYPSDAFRQTHPDTLATMATLFGLQPTPTDNCRVLELGCAGGGNIIPMAYAQRDCQFLGVDLSASQIDEGKQIIAKLGLRNIELRQGDLRTLGDQLGVFDYIITHGVYSWVPDEVRQAIIRLYRRHLAPMGVGYISFNANPGWRMYGMIRQMMLYFSRNATSPHDRIQRSRDLLTFLEQSVPTDQAYSRLLGQALAGLSDQTDSYLFHEYLEDQNDPCYFQDFAYGAAAEGLAYLGESFLSSMLDRNFGPEIQKFLRDRSSNIFELEQHMDFLRNRTFRQTLLCHAEVKLNRNLDVFDPTPYWIRSSARCLLKDPDLHTEAPLDFHLAEEMAITLTDPLAKALLTNLTRIFPRSLTFDEAVKRAFEILLPDGMPELDSEQTAHNNHQIGQLVLLLVSFGMAELHVQSYPVIEKITDRPVSWPYARFQNSTRVTSACHTTVDLDPIDARLVQLMDGTQGHTQLMQALALNDLELKKRLEHLIRMNLVVG